MSRRGYDAQPATLSEVLNGYSVDMLKGLGRLLASRLLTRKAELVAVVQEPLEDAPRLRQLWEKLDPLQQAAVSEAVHSPSARFDGDRFRAKYGKDPHWGKFSRYGRDETPSPLCLFIYNGTMPRDLQSRLQTFVPLPQAPQIRTEDALPATISQSWHEFDHVTRMRKTVTEEIPLIHCETERAAQHDLPAVLRLVEAGKVQVSEKTRRVSDAGAQAITHVLQQGDFYPPEKRARGDYTTDPGPIKAFAWPLLLQSAGLANLSGSKLQLTAAGKKALSAPPHKTLATLWNRWLKTTFFDEFSRVNAIKGQTSSKSGMTAVAGRRAAMVEALSDCPPDRWIALDELSRFMRAAGYTFEVTRNLWSLYISDPHYGALGYSGFGDWPILQGRYIMAFLFEYAATLGLIDVAYIHPSTAREDYRKIWGTDDMDCLSRYDGLFYIRVNALGAWCLGLVAEYVPSPMETKQVLKVLPNLEVVVTESLPPGEVLFLERFAERTSDRVWSIRPLRLLEALEQGDAVADIEAFLTARSGGSLPDNVSVFFKDMAERAVRLADCGPARLIEAADAALAQLIANDRRLRSLCMLAGERYIVVPAESESAFRRALRELGYGLPRSRDRES